MEPNFFFNISRIFTLIGGVMTVLGGFGLWHFGQIKEANTNEKISRSEENAERAKAEAAIAVTKSKEIELNLVEAKEETAKANQKTKEIELDIIKARAEAERAKTERVKLQQQTLKLKEENASLKIESDRIKKFEIRVVLEITDDGSFNQPQINNTSNFIGEIALLNDPGESPYFFRVISPYSISISQNRKIIITTASFPVNTEKLYTNSIKSLENIQRLMLNFGVLLDNSNIIPIEPISVHIDYIINEVSVVQKTYTEEGSQNMKSGRPVMLNIANEFNNIYKKYKSITKNL